MSGREGGASFVKDRPHGNMFFYYSFKLVDQYGVYIPTIAVIP